MDALSVFETGASLLLSSQAPTRFAVRQVLDQELHRTIAARENLARQARFKAGNPTSLQQLVFDNKENAAKTTTQDVVRGDSSVKRYFFGIIINVQPLTEVDGNSSEKRARQDEKERKVWVTYHEGLNNAVRKPISLKEFMRGL